METIAERLKWLRKYKCKKTLEEVGKHVGVGKATIQKYENGIITNIPSDKIELLAEVLDTTPGFIMGWQSDPEYEKLDRRFGDLLKKERERQQKTREQFAKEIGISIDLLTKYESGTLIPSFSEAFLISSQIGIAVDEYYPPYIRTSEKKENERLNTEIISILSSLPEKKQKQVRDYIRFLAMQEENE